MDRYAGAGESYHRRLREVYRFVIPPGQKVLEIGCGNGDLLAALEPGRGVGVDFSPAMITLAEKRHPVLCFLCADIHDLDIEETFDFIILSDLVNDLWDVEEALKRVKKLCHPSSRLVFNSYSRLWEVPLSMVRRLGLAKPNLYQNWLTVQDIRGLLHLADFEVIRNWEEVLCPLSLPGIRTFFNRYLAKIWPFRWFHLTHIIVARPAAIARMDQYEPKVSVIVPARNEAGNIAEIIRRIPEMGGGKEIVFVEGNSTDETWQVIEETIKNTPERDCRAFRQRGSGKGDAVRLGFEKAKGDILMILDADMTVPPEDLPRFYDVLVSGKGEFVNGVRLVYPMEKEAMRFFNLIGNKFFSLAFSWLLGQPIKDTLCGTKVLWKKDYERIAANRNYFGEFDPFGDFDLLFGAAKLNLKICEVPIRYRERTYGDTNISRWRHGWLLLRMVIFAVRRIKFF